MTVTYRWVQWNRHKRRYDAVLAAIVAGYLVTFIGVGTMTHAPPREVGLPVLAMRALATLAIVLLHVILLIGPLARMTPLAAPLLYNRRHLGVTFFLIALMHGVLAVGYYGAFGVREPVSATVGGHGSFGSISGFPFELLGLLALLVFFVMAATSHDFWLSNLTPRVWKAMHMLVYVAYGLVVLHVALGALQSERSPAYAVALLLGVALVAGAHLVAGMREWRRDAAGARAADGRWVDVCSIDDLQERAGHVICLRGRERVAIFRYDGRVSAVSNVCAHQGGPLGEGRIVDGCITCPWHGYQYVPDTGQSPPPFTEKIATYELRLEGRRILLNPVPRQPGTAVDPVRIPTRQRDEASPS
ncbi:MAG: ferric reductase-like transmembrane domain-containing protein [Phycisphaeraceae bacterium]|nr:ferric reductase-like transmembrane domain-containing protein [Phycisphaeraceae bacterium]